MDATTRFDYIVREVKEVFGVEPKFNDSVDWVFEHEGPVEKVGKHPSMTVSKRGVEVSTPVPTDCDRETIDWIVGQMHRKWLSAFKNYEEPAGRESESELST